MYESLDRYNRTATGGPVRIQYKCLVPIYVFPEMKLLFQNRIIMFCLPVPTLIRVYLWEVYIFPGSVCLFCCRKICEPILGIYKSLTDTSMWKLGLRPRDSQKRKTLMRFSWSAWQWKPLKWKPCKSGTVKIMTVKNQKDEEPWIVPSHYFAHKKYGYPSTECSAVVRTLLYNLNNYRKHGILWLKSL